MVKKIMNDLSGGTVVDSAIMGQKMPKIKDNATN